MALNTYLDKEKERAQRAMQPNLQTVAPLTDAGKIYQQRITQNLTNPNPVVKQATEQTDTDISRRNYLTRKQSQEDISQSPFSAGTQQAARLTDQSRAGANLANLQQRQNLNTFAQGAAERDLAAAGALEDSIYNKALGAEQTGYNRFTNDEQTKYSRGRDEEQTKYARDLAARTEGQIERGRYSSLLEDPKSRYAFNRLVASGVDPAAAYKSIVDERGSVNEIFRGASPVAILQKDAGEWVTATTGLKPGSPEYDKAVKDRIIAVDAAKQEPLKEGTESRESKALTEKNINNAISTGDYSGLIPEDYVGITKQQITNIQSKALNQDGKGIGGDTWGDQADLRDSDALEAWKNNNPILTDANIGKPIKFGENVYILTKPYELSGGDDDRKIEAFGINIRTGKEEVIRDSSVFDTENDNPLNYLITR